MGGRPDLPPFYRPLPPCTALYRPSTALYRPYGVSPPFLGSNSGRLAAR